MTADKPILCYPYQFNDVQLATWFIWLPADVISELLGHIQKGLTVPVCAGHLRKLSALRVLALGNGAKVLTEQALRILGFVLTQKP